MIKEAIGTGRTVEEAEKQARELLGPQEADIEFQVLDRPKKTLFGLKSTPARVRAYVELPEPKPAAAAPPAKAPAPPVPQPQSARGKVAVAGQSQPARDSAKPAPERVAAPKDDRPKVDPPKASPPKADAPKADAPKPDKPRRNPQPDSPEQKKPAGPKQRAGQSNAVPIDPDKISRAHSYIMNVFEAMELRDLTVTPGENDGAIVIKVEGKDNAAVIGRRGETLDALQYLTSLAANRDDGSYARVIIDTGNYRERRQETLETLGRRLAERVVRTGRSHTLEPMNAYERRIIHSAVSEVKGASSSSLGDEPNRRVMISSQKRTGSPTPAEGGHKAQGGDRGDRGGRRPPRGRGDQRGRRERPEPYKESSTREIPPAEAADKPLYGKIEL